MRKNSIVTILKKCFLTFALGILILSSAKAQTFLTAKELASKMVVGWNIGNTMEAMYTNNGQIVASETAWGNPLISQRLVDSIKAAGFNTIRIPIAWDVHSSSGTIDAAWIARVKEVVDYCYKDNLYVIINIHWDNGWLEENCTKAKQAAVNAKQKSYWTQISNYFKNYDEHLLFASANEPHVADATEMSVLLSYHQTFVDAVRATGGNNSQRILIVQGPATDIEKTNTLMNTLPKDVTLGRMMVEIHFYPYQFTLMDADADWGKQFYYWGACNHSTTDKDHNPTWGEEAWVDEMFQLMKTKFVDKGYPVLLGEFGAKNRTNLTGNAYTLHKQSREYFLKYVVRSAINHGAVPVYWCAGLGDLFNRNTGAILERGTLNALMAGAYTNGTAVNCGNNDCKGVSKGHAYTNTCNKCVLGYDASCYGVKDCNGTANGSAKLDNCDRCVGGTTGKVACAAAGEAETDACSYDGTIDNNNPGFKGTGFINVPNAIGSKITFHINATSAGTKTLSFRYASGGTADRSASVKVNGIALAANLSFPATGAFTTYKTIEVNLNFNAGTNIIQLVSATADGLANIDQIGYVSAGLSKGSCEEVITNIVGEIDTQTIELYPNPSQSSVHIRTNGLLDVEIINAEGKTLKTYINVSELEFGADLQPGIYFAKVQNKVYKFVKY